MLVVLHKGVLLEYMAQNLALGGMMETWKPVIREKEGQMKVMMIEWWDGADEDDNMSMDSNDETLTDGMKGIILVFK